MAYHTQAMELRVEVAADHLERFASARKPIVGVAELMWNSLDADARSVRVLLARSSLGAIESIEVIDDGTGIAPEEAEAGFGKLGGSWKRGASKTRKERRMLHGEKGQGRYRAFAVGESVEWTTVYRADGEYKTYSMKCGPGDKRNTTITEAKPAPASTSSTGTTARILGVVEKQGTLESGKALRELAKEFALYLKQYPDVRISYDGERVDPTELQEAVTEYTLGPIRSESGRDYDATLTVIEWKDQIERELCLCNENGFTLRELKPGIQASGYYFTAYLKSKLLSELDDSGAIEMEMFSDMHTLLEAAKDQLREHFGKRDKEKAARTIKQWKEEHIYPYDGEPKGAIEEVERAVFDVVAVTVDSGVKSFSGSDRKNKKLAFSLIRNAIESNPSALKSILSEIVGLSKEQQDEFAFLLNRVSLAGVIEASRVVANRLDFLEGLEVLLFDEKVKRQTKETTQLHRLIAAETWIFGEEYNLVHDEETLTTVLRKHIQGGDREVVDLRIAQSRYTARRERRKTRCCNC